MNRLSTLLVCAFALAWPTSGAATAATETVTVGPQYGANGLHSAMLGSSYRRLWTTPITVEVLDLAAEAGGLTPERRVGGQQTKGLALHGPDGRSYTFRSIDKDPSNILPEDLQDTFVEELVKDQMAAQHPAGALVVDELSKAAGVPTVPIRIVVMPDDPALGEFRKDFANVVGTFVGVPDGRRGRAPRVRGGHRAHRPHGDVQAARDQPRRQGRGARVPARPALRRARLRLRPPPQAVAVGAEGRGSAVAPDPGGPGPGVRAVRGAARAHGRRLHTADPQVRAGVRPDARPDVQRPRAGPLAPSGAVARGVARDRRGPEGAHDRRGHRACGPPDAPGVVRDRRAVARRGDEEAS